MATTTNDPMTILPDELLRSFGTSAPSGNTQINSTKTSRTVTDTLYCRGDAYIYGRIRTPLRLEKAITFADGSVGAPSIAFDSDPDTGLYRAADGSIGFTSNGVEKLIVSPSAVQVDAPLTTGSGNLVFDPAGTSIDFTNHTLINVGGVTVSVGLPNHVIINDNTANLTSEARLAPVRGGTGQDSSAATGVARVTAGTWSFAPLTDADFGTINNLTVTQLSADSITSTGDITITAGGGDVFVGSAIIHQSPTTVPGGDSATYTANVLTTNATTTTLATIPTVTGCAYGVRGLITLIDLTGGANTGMFTFAAKAKNIGGVVSTSAPIQSGTSLDGSLSTTTITVTSSGTNILVRVVGLAATNIRWMGRFDVVAQQL
jgi:hypothetical protein